jgi:hypothetical protein
VVGGVICTECHNWIVTVEGLAYRHGPHPSPHIWRPELELSACLVAVVLGVDLLWPHPPLGMPASHACVPVSHLAYDTPAVQ